MSETVQVCYSTFSSPVRRVIADLERRHAHRTFNGPAARTASGSIPNRNGDGMTRHIARCESSSKPFSAVSCRLSNFRYE